MEIPSLNDVEAWSGGLSEGTHVCVVDGAELSTSNSGKQAIAIQLKGAANDSEPGATLRDWLYLTPDALGRLKSFLEAINYPIPAGNFQPDFSQMVGKTLKVGVVHDLNPSDGKKYSRAGSFRTV